jgi:Helix-turn-helix
VKAIDRFQAKVVPSGSCQEWGGAKNSDGYGYFKADGKDWRATRWIFWYDHGYLPPVVMHACDNPGCVNLRHLIPGTQADNMADKMAKGRHKWHNPPRKLSAGQVREIRELAKNVKQVDLARRYGVSSSHISNIVRGKKRIQESDK